jgi:hypothetical protein
METSIRTDIAGRSQEVMSPMIRGAAPVAPVSSFSERGRYEVSANSRGVKDGTAGSCRQAVAALAIMWVGLFVLGGWAALQSRQAMLEERQIGVRNVVESALSILRVYGSKVADHSMSLEEAQREALAELVQTSRKLI